MKWHPIDSHYRYAQEKLTEGTLIAWDFKAWRLIEIRPMDDGERISYRLRPAEDDWTALGRNDVHISGGKYARLDVLPDHYSVCAKCGDVQPCREVTAERVALEEMERADRYDVFLRCPACLETVTPRQKQISFKENVVSVLGPMVTFHLRDKCWSTAVSYEKKWAEATGGKLTLSCPDGTAIRHHDDTYTCTSIDCPNPHEAQHRQMCACWVMGIPCNRPECMAVIEQQTTRTEGRSDSA